MPYWVSSGTAGTTSVILPLTGNRIWSTLATAATTPIWYEPPITRSWYEQQWPEWSVYDAPQNEREYAAPQLTDQQLYEKAVAEHDVQEATRLQAVIEERRAAVEQRQRADNSERARQEAAKQCARELLLQHLTPAQQETYRRNNWFIVEGSRSKIKYKIHGEHLTANIDVLDRHGGKTHRLCGHAPAHQIPIGDNLLAQKLMLECDEDAFLRIANVHRHIG